MRDGRVPARLTERPTREADMTNNIEILLMVIAINGSVLGLACLALWRLNRAVDGFDG